MPIDFPDNPTVNQEFLVDGRSWTWTGTTWDAVLETADIPLFATVPLSFNSETRTISIDLSNYATTTDISDFVIEADIDSKIATQVASLVDSAPTTLDTLNELAAALGDDPDFATTIINSIGEVESDVATLQSNLSTVESDLELRPLSHNYIINGAFDFWQRGTSFSAADNLYSADRWQIPFWNNVGSGAATVSQSTDTPGVGEFSWKLDVTTAEASQDAHNQIIFAQSLEAQDIKTLRYFESNPDTVTVSFWVKSNLTGDFGIDLNFGVNNSALENTASRIYSTNYTISSADTWEKKSITVQLDSSSLVKSTETNRGMSLIYWLGSGSSRDGSPANVWRNASNANNNGATQKNILGSTDNYWQITGVQLEAGSVATSFKRHAPSLQGELAACQRYYQRFDSDVNKTVFPFGVAIGSTASEHYQLAPVTMRKAPTSITFSSNMRVYDGASQAFTISNLVTHQVKPSFLGLRVTTSGMTTYRNYKIITQNAQTGFVAFEAEL